MDKSAPVSEEGLGCSFWLHRRIAITHGSFDRPSDPDRTIFAKYNRRRSGRFGRLGRGFDIQFRQSKSGE